ncbi:phage terminase small subunit P27 family [Paracoccus nototheniae]|uniref:Phage terminase small subunit P27 family n=1 Tax=Paracoccus nototheniae TaxID=2489002 RepID=A0ABW4DV39_9RHOB|nr:phage terminase small subunit P27 family [Paracoccus nototheniae]
MAGRKRKPDILKKLTGTAQPSRMNAAAPPPNQGEATAPDWLSARGAELFAQISGTLVGMGIASPDDQHTLALLSSRLEEVEILTSVVEDAGRTYKAEGGLWKARPEVSMRNEAMRHAQSLLAEFGLTPAARSKVSAGKPAEANPFGALDSAE